MIGHFVQTIGAIRVDMPIRKGHFGDGAIVGDSGLHVDVQTIDDSTDRTVVLPIHQRTAEITGYACISKFNRENCWVHIVVFGLV